jgi:acyl-CoA reductase-like NAD-dependent aldehyde dehydrogenase
MTQTVTINPANPDLTQLDFTMTINGKRVSSAETFEVTNPATDQVIAHAPKCSDALRDEAVVTAHRAFENWKRDEDFRRECLLKLADAIEENAELLGTVMTLEQGKPVAECIGDAVNCAEWFRYYAKMDNAPVVAQDDDVAFIEIVRKPLGVVVGIIPWNSPLLLISWKAAPALLAGNTMVIKPSSSTPLSALVMGEIMRPFLPEGVFSVVSGPEPLGSNLLTHPLVRKVSFTGSTEVGKQVAANAATDLKRVTLELGGNDAAIVLDDASPEKFAEDLFWGAFKNNGQMCALIKRLYVPEHQREAYAEAIGAVAKQVRLGNGLDPTTQLGPLTTGAQLRSIKELAKHSLANGAHVFSGGQAVEGPGNFFAPTILSGVQEGDRIVDEEQFGPIMPIIGYTDVDDAVARANNSVYGLAGSVWGEDLDRAREVAFRLESGQAAVNNHTRGIRRHLPFGGAKWSGLGIENGVWGLDAFSQIQSVASPSRR